MQPISSAWGPLTFLPVTLGMYGMAAYENADPSTIIYQVIVTELGPVMAGLMLAAIVAAVMSTCDTTIMTIVTSVVYDAYGNVLAPKYNLPVDEKTKKLTYCIKDWVIECSGKECEKGVVYTTDGYLTT